MIYLTQYDPTTLQCTGVSEDAGFTTLDEVVSVMGEPLMRAARMVTYEGGVCFSDFPLSIKSCAS